MKDIYILKKINKIRLEKIYTDNRLKSFKTKIVEDSSTKRIETYEMLNIMFENLIDAMKKSNIVNKNVRINEKVRNEIARDAAESSNANDQIFEDIITVDNLSNSKIRNIHARTKSSTRRSNQLIEIENPLSSVERRTNTIMFATIDEISIEKK